MKFLTMPYLVFCFSLNLAVFWHTSLAEVGGASGSVESTISAGSAGSPTWKIATASNLGDPVFIGSVSSVDGYKISFPTSLDDSNATVYPFLNDSVFIPSIEMPQKSALLGAISGGSVTGGTATYSSSTYGTKVGFSAGKPPAVIVAPSDGGGTTAKLTANLDANGLINSFTQVEGGTGYTVQPQLTIVGGPHLVRIIDEDSNSTGKFFLIQDNNQTTLHLDSTLSASGYFSEGTLVEVVAAPTLGSILGVTSASVTSASKWSAMGSEDWVYVYDIEFDGYIKYSHISGAGGDGLQGWYSRHYGFRSRMNNAVIYPDQAFIVANRTAGTITLETDLVQTSGPAQIQLPEASNNYVANNPFGMDVMLAEIIPSTAIGSSSPSGGTSKFNSGSGSEKDTITILSGAEWKTYWYDSTSTNSAVTSLMKAGSRAGTGGSGAMQSSDLLIRTAAITDLASCSDAAGNTVVTNYNDGDYTKISTSGTAPSAGFSVTISNLQGYMLNDAGTYEVNATTGENVDTNGSGSVIYSNISGSYEVVGSGSGYFVIEKQRDVNFKDEGSPTWSVGSAGAGYTTTARWWAIGGGGTGAYGTVNSTGTSFTVTAGGSGYSSAPQLVISGGGWRLLGGESTPRGNEVITASDGLIISRHSDYGGIRTYIESPNPTN